MKISNKGVVMMVVEITDIRKAQGDSKLRAFASVKFGGSLIVRGFCVVDGPHGTFVKPPSKPGKDGKWIDIIAIDEFLKREVQDKVLEAYDREIDGVVA